MTANLFLDRWKGLDPHEVRLVLDKRFGGPGQYDSESAGAERLHLPRARSSCRVALDFDLKDNSVKAIKSGPAFDAAEWRQVSKEMDGLLGDGPLKIGRQFSFSSYRVPGTWRGKDSFVQIMPVPADAPQSSVEAADHPFVLEFPFVASDFDLVTRYRWQREHRRLTRLLNVLLNGHTSHELA